MCLLSYAEHLPSLLQNTLQVGSQVPVPFSTSIGKKIQIKTDTYTIRAGFLKTLIPVLYYRCQFYVETKNQHLCTDTCIQVLVFKNIDTCIILQVSVLGGNKKRHRYIGVGFKKHTYIYIIGVSSLKINIYNNILQVPVF